MHTLNNVERERPSLHTAELDCPIKRTESVRRPYQHIGAGTKKRAKESEKERVIHLVLLESEKKIVNYVFPSQNTIQSNKSGTS